MNRQKFFGLLKGATLVALQILSWPVEVLIVIGDLAQGKFAKYFSQTKFYQLLTSPLLGDTLLSRIGRLLLGQRLTTSFVAGVFAGGVFLLIYFQVRIERFDGKYYVLYGDGYSTVYAQENYGGDGVVYAAPAQLEEVPLITETTEAGDSASLIEADVGEIKAGVVVQRTNVVASEVDTTSVKYEGEMIMPLRNPPRLQITSRFSSWHPAVDLSTELGTPLYPVADGVVVSTGSSIWAYGKVVVIDHGDGFTSLYAHMHRVDVSVGQYVNKDTSIGTVGSTGNSSGPHVHLEIRKDGVALNPIGVVKGM
jgi:hypothetical protein